MKKKVLITGGGGYVGSVLSDYLVDHGYDVTCLDLYIYGEKVFFHDKEIKKVIGDIRDQNLLKKIIPGHDYLIHLACISNDPSFELNPELGKSINLDAFEPLIKISKDNGIKRFIYASSSSVYGIKKEENVTENMILEPLTDYSKFKVECEDISLKYVSDNFEVAIIRPSTVCGVSLRMRFDLVVNILTNLGYHKRKISVFGGKQLRPNVHIKDMARSYLEVLKKDELKGDGNIFNVGTQNLPVQEIANLVKQNLGDDIELITSHSDDNRSYHVSSQKFSNFFNFKFNFTISDAINDLKVAFDQKKFSNSLTNKFYFNIKMMNSINLK